jgi:hypothetical protein
MTTGAEMAAFSPSEASLVGLPSRPQIYAFDHVLADPVAYRATILALPFRDVTVGAVTFKGIADVDDSAMAKFLLSHWPELNPMLTFARQSPAGQEEPHFIHTDRDMGGEWTAILYLSDPTHPSDGTAFWAHRETNACLSTAYTPEEFHVEYQSWRDDRQWHIWRTIEAKFNRMVVFPAAAFHSRAIRENYGTGPSARLTQVMFGTFKEQP